MPLVFCASLYIESGSSEPMLFEPMYEASTPDAFCAVIPEPPAGDVAPPGGVAPPAGGVMPVGGVAPPGGGVMPVGGVMPPEGAPPP